MKGYQVTYKIIGRPETPFPGKYPKRCHRTSLKTTLRCLHELIPGLDFTCYHLQYKCYSLSLPPDLNVSSFLAMPRRARTITQPFFLTLLQTSATLIRSPASHIYVLTVSDTETHNVGISPNMQRLFKNEWVAKNLTNVDFSC